MKLPNSPSSQYRRHHPPPNYHKSRPKGHKIGLGLIASLDGRRGKRSRAKLFRILEFGSKYIHLIFKGNKERKTSVATRERQKFSVL